MSAEVLPETPVMAWTRLTKLVTSIRHFLFCYYGLHSSNIPQTVLNYAVKGKGGGELRLFDMMSRCFCSSDVASLSTCRIL